MPELPEVETVKNKISPYIVGKTIRDIKTFYSKYAVLDCIKNEKINSIERRGKYLIFVLDDYYMISHLRMEGKYFIKENPVKEKHDLVFFEFDGFTLIYNDVRKFGMFYLFDKKTDICSIEPLSKVGKEPFDMKKEELYSLLHNKKEHIKTLLLDQSIISGLGNIYVDEVLFKSRLSPLKEGKDITLGDCESIIKYSIETLNDAIKNGGSTIRSFESFNGETGHFQSHLLVHSREMERCKVCGNIIQKIRVNGRGTYYCPTCQNDGKKVYAITGTIASGKSTVLSYLNDLGYKTYSTDEIYSNLFINNKKMQKEILSSFNTLDKEKIKEIISKNPAMNKKLMDITHKYVMSELWKMIDSDNSKVVFVEVPLLFEGGYEKTFTSTIDIYQNNKVEEVLYNIRGIDKVKQKAFLSLQLSKDDKKTLSEYIIYNNGTIDDLKKETDKLLKKLEV